MEIIEKNQINFTVQSQQVDWLKNLGVFFSISNKEQFFKVADFITKPTLIFLIQFFEVWFLKLAWLPPDRLDTSSRVK
jgi:hypothetical protein